MTNLPPHVVVQLVRDSVSLLSDRIYVENSQQTADILVSTANSDQLYSASTMKESKKKRTDRQRFMRICENVYDGVLIQIEDYRFMRSMFVKYGEQYEQEPSEALGSHVQSGHRMTTSSPPPTPNRNALNPKMSQKINRIGAKPSTSSPLCTPSMSSDDEIANASKSTQQRDVSSTSGSGNVPEGN